MADGARPLAVAGHPLVVAGLVALVVNDNVLKGWSGGVDGLGGLIARGLTGKASDLAGVLVLAVLVGAVTGRRRAAVVAVGLAFAALKLSPAVADLAVPILGGRARTDPWDLLALVALVPADRVLRPVDLLPAPDLRPAWASLRATLGVAVVTLSVPAMTATSCVGAPIGINRVGVLSDGSVAAFTATDGNAVADTWFVSQDRGRTWAEEAVDESERSRLLRGPERVEACTADGCLRSGGATIEEGSDAAGWRTSFAYSDADRARMRADSTGCGGSPEPAIGEIVSVDGTAVAAAGEFGVVRREPGADWEEVSVGRLESADELPPAWPRHLTWAPMVALGVLIAAHWASHARAPARSPLRRLSIVLAATGVVIGVGVTLVASLAGPTPRESGQVIGVTTGIVLVVALLPLGPLLLGRSRDRPEPPSGGS